MKKFYFLLYFIMTSPCFAQAIGNQTVPPIFQGNSTAVQAQRHSEVPSPIAPTTPPLYNNFPYYNNYQPYYYQQTYPEIIIPSQNTNHSESVENIENNQNDASEDVSSVKRNISNYINKTFPYNTGNGEIVSIINYSINDNLIIDITFNITSDSNDDSAITGQVHMTIPVISNSNKTYNINVGKGIITDCNFVDPSGTQWSHRDYGIIKKWFAKTIILAFNTFN